MGMVSELRQIIGGDLSIPLLDGSLRRYINLDNAASTPVLKPVQEGLNRFVEWYSSIHRGAGFKSQLASWAYEEARKLVVSFLGGDPCERVAIFGKNTTEAVNKLANRYPFKSGDVLLTSLMEHHSNDLPWRRHVKVEWVGLDGDGRVDLNHLEAKLKQHEGKVPLVAITGASNVSGIINPIYKAADLAHKYGAQLFVDAAQLAPHRRINMGKRGEERAIDYLAISAHKMYAPYGTGALIGWPDVFLQGPPDYSGGGTVKFVNHEDIIWRDPPDREEAGSPNVVGVVALGFAVKTLGEIGMETVAEHECSLTERMLSGLEKIGQIELYGTRRTDPDFRLGVVPFNVSGMPHPKTAAILGCEFGVGVRHGCFCAHPYVKSLLDFSDDESDEFYEQILRGLPVELPGMVRISFGMYNQAGEVDFVLQAMEKISREAYRGNYILNPESGEYWPEGFAPRYHEFFSF
ncbi:MAG: aminotransferase class V-fold PLP-dependent enzyme [bacterium]